MEELEKEVKAYLLQVYTAYLEKGGEHVQQAAEKVYCAYLTASTLLSKKTMQAIGTLFPVAYPHVDSGAKPPTKERVEEIIRYLRE